MCSLYVLRESKKRPEHFISQDGWIVERDVFFSKNTDMSVKIQGIQNIHLATLVVFAKDGELLNYSGIST